MPLPDLIEIVPLTGHVKAEITVPGSKSITNRALILAALADGQTVLKGALWSEDTQVMVEALLKLGFDVKVEPDPEEFCNRTITVVGLGGKPNRQYASELAERGYVTLAPNYPRLAKYQPDLKALGWESGTLKAVWPSAAMRSSADRRSGRDNRSPGRNSRGDRI